MMQYQLSSKEHSMVGIMTVFGKDNMKTLIGLVDTDTRMTFGHLFAAMDARDGNYVLPFQSIAEQKAFWAAITAREDEVRKHSDAAAAAYEAAAKLVVDLWVDYPRPGTEHPYTPGFLKGNQHRRRICDDLVQYACAILKEVDNAEEISQIQCWNYTIINLYNKLCWYYYERSDHTVASYSAERAAKFCESAMKDMMCYEEYAKWLVLLSDMQQARAVIASDLGDVETAMTLGQKQIETATAATGSAPRAKTTELARAYLEMGKIMIINQDPAAAETYFNKAVPVLEALPGYKKLHMYAFLHGLGWNHLLKREYQEAEDCFSRALRNRAKAFGVDDTEGVQTGELLYGLGIVCAVQGRMVESFNYFGRGSKQLERATNTAVHWNVAKMRYKLAIHYQQEHDYNQARALLSQCDEYYKTASHFNSMRARVLFRLSQCYIQLGRDYFPLAGDTQIFAWELRKPFRPHDTRGPTQLTMKDYDELVVFWCR